MDGVDKGEALVATFAHYGVDVRRGRGKVSGPCHVDNVPSVSVNVGKGVWHCFACDVGGDYLELIKHMEGVGFLDARGIARGWGIGSATNGLFDRSVYEDTGVSRWGSSPQVSARKKTRHRSGGGSSRSRWR